MKDKLTITTLSADAVANFPIQETALRFAFVCEETNAVYVELPTGGFLAISLKG